MILSEITYLAGITLMIVACLALAVQNLLIRKGTDTGRVYDAVLIVILVNLVVLIPTVGIYHYPDYGINTRSLLSFIAAGIFGTMLGRIFKYASISEIGASRTEPIVNVNILVATALGVLLLGEQIEFVQLLAILSIVIGVSLISLETTQENPHNLSRRKLLLGMLLPFGGAVAYGFEPIFASYGMDAGTAPTVGVLLKTIAATIGFVAYLRFTGSMPVFGKLDANDVKIFTLAGLCNTVFLVAYYAALGIAPVSVVVPILPANTLFTIALAALFMPERLEHITPRLIGAATIVVAGVVVLTVMS